MSEATTSMLEPVLAIGWDVGGWSGSKQGLAAFLSDGGQPRLLAQPKSVRLRPPLGALDWEEFLLVAPGVGSLPSIPKRVVLAIDAPFGFPVEFRKLLDGGPCGPWKTGQLANGYAFRATDRHVAGLFKTPLSAPFDKLGNNATVAIHHLCQWRAQGVQVLPFDQDNGRGPVALEVYPAIALDCKKGKRPAWCLSLTGDPLPTDSDAADALVCAVLALAWAQPGRWGLPHLQGPIEPLPDGEGWIYYPQNSAWKQLARADAPNPEASHR